MTVGQTGAITKGFDQARESQFPDGADDNLPRNTGGRQSYEPPIDRIEPPLEFVPFHS